MQSTKVVHLQEHFPSPDSKLLNLIVARRRARRRLRRHPGSSSHTEFNRISASLRRYANHVRWSQQWPFCEELSTHTPGSKIWKIIRSLTRRPIRLFETIALTQTSSLKELPEDIAYTYEGERTALRVLPIGNTASNDMDDAFTKKE